MNTFAKPAFGSFVGVDAVASATPIGATVAGDRTPTQLFLGNIPGTIGETCKLALLIGAAYLFVRKVISGIFRLRLSARLRSATCWRRALT